MVQLREVADAPSPLHGVPNVGPSDQEAVEEDWQGLPVAAPEGAVGWWLWGERATEAVLEYLGDTRVQGVGWEGKGG